MARLKLAFARDPQRARSRVVLALFTVFALVAIGVPDLSNLRDLAFGQQPSPTPTGFTIQFLNPSGHSKDVSHKPETGGDDDYHLVAWVNRLPSSPSVEFKYRVSGGDRDITIGIATQRGSDTFDLFWDAANQVPADGTITLKAILFSGTTEVARDEEANVVVNNQTDTTQVHTAEDQANTVEITKPLNAAEWGLFQPTGQATAHGVIDVRFSAGTENIRAFYTLSTPGTEPSWKECGGPETAVNSADGVRCTLKSGDTPSQVTAVAVRAEDTEQPAHANSAQDSGDAHRVVPYVQTPAGIQINLPQQTRSDTDPNTAGNQWPCVEVTATVVDQKAQKIAGVNVDVHAQGPDDNLSFDDDETAATQSDRHKAPDKAHAATESSVDCEAAAKPAAGTQGEHEIGGGGADIKHVESTTGTTDGGTHRFALYSPNTGATQYTAWADTDDDDVYCSAEANGSGSIGWGQGAPGVTGVPADTTTCPSPTPTASPTPTPTPTPTATGTGTPSPTPTQSARTITLAADDASVDAGESVRLSGAIFSGNAGCRDNEFVRIRRRVHGTPTFTDFASATTDANGNYDLPVKVTANSDFQAVAPAHDNCAEASSDPITVLARVRVSIDASDRRVPRGDRVTIFGTVRPNHGGDRVILERKRGDDFVRVSVDTLNRRSRYSFVIRVTWSRGRVFRVSWREQDDDHESNQSETIRIRRQR